MVDAAIAALIAITSPVHILHLFFGVAIGLIVGILPGLGGTAGLALLLPFVFGMDPSLALAMMIGLQSVTTTSDTFPSVLMGIPGTSGSQATVLDGFPLAKKGEGARALSAAFISSMFGGVFGALVLSVAIFFAMPIILAVGFGEQMMLVVLALTMVGMLTGANAWKGLASCGLGLMLGSLGAAPFTGIERLDFGTDYLIDPLPLVVVGLAMFATPEIVDLLRRQETISEKPLMGQGWTVGLRDWLANKWLSLRCAAIGCLVGALPGLGGTVIDWIAYGHAMQTTNNKERYGTGDIRGVIAPESANNAKEGGALVPTLLFGIPGSGSMAILLGGFVLIGIEPGVEMVTDDLDLVYLIIWSVALANILGAGTCFFLAPQISKLTTIKYTLLAPIMFGLIFFAAFQATRSWGDLIALFIVSVLGIYMKRFGWPRPALLIGFVLADQVEELVYQTFTVYGLSAFERPLVLVLSALTALSVFAVVKFKAKSDKVDKDEAHSNKDSLPQLTFLLFLFGFICLLFFDAIRYDYLTGLFPIFATSLTTAFLVPLVFQMIKADGPNSSYYDAERVVTTAGGLSKSNEHYILWIAGMLLFSALVGFVIGIAGFILIFLLIKARLSPLKSTSGALLFVIFLGILSDRLTLQYPTGFLQDSAGINLPWPLQ